MMNLSIVSFTENGIQLSKKMKEKLGEINLFTKCKEYAKVEEAGKIQYVEKSISDWTAEQMKKRNALLFIGACGIAVRAIAPHITDKLHDSPVLVTDEKGRYVIPILSGHMGGANELALLIAKEMGAEPVITTATDINKKFAVDLFAKKNGFFIVNKEGIAEVSAKLLSGQNITISVERGHGEDDCKWPEGVCMASYPPGQQVDIVITSEKKEFNTSLLLKPKEYVIGMGCRKGKEAEKIEAFLLKHLQKAGISTVQVAGLSSIDLKKEEPGFLLWCRKENIPFVTFSAEELKCVEGDFHKSEFVKEQVGVDNVCERAALKAAGPEGKLVYEKHAEDGMTMAIAKKKWKVSFDET